MLFYVCLCVHPNVKKCVRVHVEASELLDLVHACTKIMSGHVA